MSTDRVEAVERALAVLDAFQADRTEMTLAEIAAATGFYKSTILRLAGSLERSGYLVRAENGVFRLGPAVWRLGSIYRAGFVLGEAVRPQLRRLVEATGETASFYVREGATRVCLFRQNSPHAARHLQSRAWATIVQRVNLGAALCGPETPDRPANPLNLIRLIPA